MDKHSIIRITALCATLIALIIMLVGNTFSWYDREHIYHTNEWYNQLNYEKTGKINFESGDSTVVTYLGTLQNGDIVYDTENPLSGTPQVDVEAYTPTYFKTVITNNDTSGDSVVSLYLNSLQWSSNLGNTIHIGIMGPEKTYKDYTSDAQTLGKTCIEDNITLKKGTAENPSVVEVIWYVRSDASVQGTVTLGAQYPVYN